MRDKAGSRKRITLKYPPEVIRIVLLICLLCSVAAFAASREKTTPASPTTVANQSQPANVPQSRTTARPVSGQPSVPSANQHPTSGKQTNVASKSQTPSLASVQPFPESTGFRLLWLTAGFGLVVLLRCRRKET